MALPNSAKQIVADFLSIYGLGGLTDWAWNIYRQAGGGSTGIDAINAELPNTSQFKARFPAYEALAKAGHAMSIQSMLDYENTARQIFHNAGLPPGFYDQPADFAKFMLGNVSTSELQQRVQLAQQATIGADPNVKAQLTNLFGMDQGHLAAYFLDPNAAEPILAQRFTAAQIAAESDKARVAQLSASDAMRLASEGITQSQAQQGFQQLGTEKGLFQSQTTGEQTIGLAAQLGAQFEGDTSAQLAFQQRQAARKAQFAGSSGFQVGQQGVSGLAPTKQSA